MSKRRYSKRNQNKKVSVVNTEPKMLETSKEEVMKLETSKEEMMRLETSKTEVKKIETTKAEPVTKRIETKKNSGNAKVYLQYDGKEIDVSSLIKKIEDSVPNSESLRIYIKPADNKAYYVCEDKTGDIEI